LTLLSCGYRNTSDRMVILRCVGPEQFFLERVVFPFELLSFECPPQSVIKVWTHGLGGPDLVETIQAHDLLLEPPSSPAQLEALSGASSNDLTWAQAG
jgi:hypothetical protein